MQDWKNPIEKLYKKLPEGRCHPCEYARAVVAQNEWTFLGCYHKPYNGKRVCEIKDCPKVK